MDNTLTIAISKLLENDIGTLRRLISIGPPLYGRADLNLAGGSIIYTAPDGDETIQSDSFPYTIEDSYGQLSTATVNIIFRGITAVDDFIGNVACGTNVTIPTTLLMANDRGEGIFVSSITDPVHGTATLTEDGVVNYRMPCPVPVVTPGTPATTIPGKPIVRKRFSYGGTTAGAPSLVYGEGNPNDLNVGDMLIMWMDASATGGNTPTPETGWTPIYYNGRTAMFKRIVDANYIDGQAQSKYEGDFGAFYPYFLPLGTDSATFEVQSFAIPNGISADDFIIDADVQYQTSGSYTFRRPALVNDAYRYTYISALDAMGIQYTGDPSTVSVFENAWNVEAGGMASKGDYPESVTFTSASRVASFSFTLKPGGGTVIPGTPDTVTTPAMPDKDTFVYTIKDGTGSSASATVTIGFVGGITANDDTISVAGISGAQAYVILGNLPVQLTDRLTKYSPVGSFISFGGAPIVTVTATNTIADFISTFNDLFAGGAICDYVTDSGGVVENGMDGYIRIFRNISFDDSFRSFVPTSIMGTGFYFNYVDFLAPYVWEEFPAETFLANDKAGVGVRIESMDLSGEHVLEMEFDADRQVLRVQRPRGNTATLTDTIHYTITDNSGAKASAKITINTTPATTRYPRRIYLTTTEGADYIPWRVQMRQDENTPYDLWIPQVGHLAIVTLTTDAASKNRDDIMITAGWTVIAQAPDAKVGTRVFQRVITQTDIDTILAGSQWMMTNANPYVTAQFDDQHSMASIYGVLQVFECGPLDPNNTVIQVACTTGSSTLNFPPLTKPSFFFVIALARGNGAAPTGPTSDYSGGGYQQNSLRDNIDYGYQHDGYTNAAGPNPYNGATISGAASIVSISFSLNSPL